MVFDLLVDERGKCAGRRAAPGAPSAGGEIRRTLFRRSSCVCFAGTPDLARPGKWLRTMGGGLDGIIAKRPGSRSMNRASAPERCRRSRTCARRIASWADSGMRRRAGWSGSLLLGLYDEDGLLHHVGFTSWIPAAEKRATDGETGSLREPPASQGARRAGRAAGARSGRENGNRSRLSWWWKCSTIISREADSGMEPAPALAPDKAPRQCTLAQVERESRSPLGLIA